MPETSALPPIAALPQGERRADAERLDAIFREVTGWKPVVWMNGKALGYGRYAYTYDSGHSGEAFATGFKPSGRKMSIYILPGYSGFPDIEKRLGNFERGKSCWYVRRLSDIDEEALRDLIRAGLDDLATKWPVTPT